VVLDAAAAPPLLLLLPPELHAASAVIKTVAPATPAASLAL